MNILNVTNKMEDPQTVSHSNTRFAKNLVPMFLKNFFVFASISEVTDVKDGPSFLLKTNRPVWVSTKLDSLIMQLISL